MREIYSLTMEKEVNLRDNIQGNSQVPLTTRQRSGSNVSSTSSLSQGSTVSYSSGIVSPSQSILKLQITEHEKQLFESIFQNISSGTGKLTLDQVKPTFTQSNLDPKYLWAVWQLCNIGAKDHITKQEFFYAMFFIENSRKTGTYVSLPSSIPLNDIEIVPDIGQPTNEFFVNSPQIKQSTVNHLPVNQSSTILDNSNLVNHLSNNEMVSTSAAQSVLSSVNELLLETRIISQDMLRINNLSEMSRAQYDETRNQVNNLQETVHNYQQDINRALNEMSHIQTELANFRTQIVLLNQDKEAFTSQINIIQSTNTQLIQELKNCELEYQKLSEENKSSKKNFEIKSSELETLKQEILKIKSENEILKQESTPSISNNIIEEINKLKNELKELEIENDSLKKKIQTNNELSKQQKILQQEKLDLQKKIIETKKIQENLVSENKKSSSNGFSSTDLYVDNFDDIEIKTLPKTIEVARQLPSPPVTESTRQLPPPPVTESTRQLPPPPISETTRQLSSTENAFSDSGFDDFDNAFSDDNAFENAFQTSQTVEVTPTSNKEFSSAFDDDDDWGDF